MTAMRSGFKMRTASKVLDRSFEALVCMQVLKFVGCYHGHADSFLVQAGSGVATLGLPDSPGVPASSTGAVL